MATGSNGCLSGRKGSRVPTSLAAAVRGRVSLGFKALLNVPKLLHGDQNRTAEHATAAANFRMGNYFFVYYSRATINEGSRFIHMAWGKGADLRHPG